MLFFNKVAGLRSCEQTPKFISCADIVIFQKHIFQNYFKIFIAHDSSYIRPFWINLISFTTSSEGHNLQTIKYI